MITLTYFLTFSHFLGNLALPWFVVFVFVLKCTFVLIGGIKYLCPFEMFELSTKTACFSHVFGDVLFLLNVLK